MTTDVPGLLRALLAADPASPRLTWYGPAGERVEFSAKTLDNWVAKTANLLVDELDAGPGSRVVLDLPAHWRSAVWALAVWSVGGCVVADPPPGAAADVWVTTTPDAVPAGTGAQVVAVALAALATRFPMELPPGVLDAAAEARIQGDVFVPPVRPAPTDPALVVGSGPVVAHRDLLPVALRAAGEAGLPSGVRLLAGGGPESAVQEVLAPLVRSGSVVLHGDLAGLGAPALASLVAQEQVSQT